MSVLCRCEDSARASELMLLQQLEEVLDFEAAVLRHVCAMNGVPNSILAELSSKRKNIKLMKCMRYNSDRAGKITYLMVLGRKCLAISGS